MGIRSSRSPAPTGRARLLVVPKRHHFFPKRGGEAEQPCRDYARATALHSLMDGIAI